jgi:hypothetical protein
VAEKQRSHHPVVSYHCLLAPVRRAPQAQPDLLRIARIEFGDDLEAITRQTALVTNELSSTPKRLSPTGVSSSVSMSPVAVRISRSTWTVREFSESASILKDILIPSSAHVPARLMIILAEKR